MRLWYKLVIDSCLVQVWLHRSGRPPLHELDQGQVIGSTLEWQSLIDSLSTDIAYCFHYLSNYSNITLHDWD